MLGYIYLILLQGEVSMATVEEYLNLEQKIASMEADRYYTAQIWLLFCLLALHCSYSRRKSS